MKWQIQIDLFRPGGGVTMWASTLTQKRAPTTGETIRISGLAFQFDFVRQVDVEEWQAISRLNVATEAQVRQLRQGLTDAGFKQVGSFRQR